jgi:predicted AlkP superfamily pyrophosphatase or phosphodiesterase
MSAFFRTSLVAAIIATASLQAEAQEVARPALILQITVDGLRGDLLQRYRDRFGPGGFRFLLEKGVVYGNAHFSHANTETVVGHATLATGAHPSDHGLVGNVVFDRENGELAYNLEDDQSPLLPTRETSNLGAQVDPAQKRSRSQGRSPVKLLTSTFADELSVHFAGKPKIFAVSGKDRSAIVMAGFAGKAFWFSTDTGDYQSSSYYYKAYPEWVKAWNRKRPAADYDSKSWVLANDKSTYLLGAHDDRPYETDLKGYGRTFPHPFGSADGKTFNTRLLFSPVGDKLTADFAKTIINEEKLGKDDIPDYLSVSFSGVDAVNHFFGPSSLENEEAVLQLDRIIADLLTHVNKTIGLAHVIIVLSADHGMPEAPERMAEQGMAVQRIDSKKISEAASRAASEKFGKDDLVLSFYRPYLYLNTRAIIAEGLDRRHVESVMADAIGKVKGIAHAIPTSSLPGIQDTPLVRKVRLNTHSERSGDIYIVQQPYWYLQEGGPIAVMHGSPWTYDTHVPIIVAGADIQPRFVGRLVHPVSIAPTLATLIGTKPPSAAFAEPLKEVLESRP